MGRLVRIIINLKFQTLQTWSRSASVLARLTASTAAHPSAIHQENYVMKQQVRHETAGFFVG